MLLVASSQRSTRSKVAVNQLKHILWEAAAQRQVRSKNFVSYVARCQQPAQHAQQSGGQPAQTHPVQIPRVKAAAQRQLQSINTISYVASM
jgi:hypothetical protein